MSDDERQPTVFAAPDQGDMIARIDAVEDDDLASSFFDSSIQDVENAAVRMFDIGIRTITEDAPAASPAFGTREPAPPAATQQVAPGVDARFQDPAVRAAFVLGGPPALPGT